MFSTKAEDSEDEAEDSSSDEEEEKKKKKEKKDKKKKEKTLKKKKTKTQKKEREPFAGKLTVQDLGEESDGKAEEEEEVPDPEEDDAGNIFYSTYQKLGGKKDKQWLKRYCDDHPNSFSGHQKGNQVKSFFFLSIS